LCVFRLQASVKETKKAVPGEGTALMRDVGHLSGVRPGETQALEPSSMLTALYPPLALK
jgi:hypothetical protein